MNSPQRSLSTRRRFIAAATVLAASVSTGAVWLSFRPEQREAWIEGMLRKNLPGIRLDPQSLATFIRSFAQRREFEDRRMNIAVWMDRMAPAIARRIPKAERRIERLERLAISEYLLGSNFFRVTDPRSEVIVYGGPLPACGNPFAVFRSQ